MKRWKYRNPSYPRKPSPSTFSSAWAWALTISGSGDLPPISFYRSTTASTTGGGAGRPMKAVMKGPTSSRDLGPPRAMSMMAVCDIIIKGQGARVMGQAASGLPEPLPPDPVLSLSPARFMCRVDELGGILQGRLLEYAVSQ